MTLHAYQQYGAAAQAYERAASLDTATFDWPYLLGTCHMELGDFEAAAKSFRKALELQPGNLPAMLRLGQSLLGIAAWDEARSLFLQILAQHPDCPQAWFGLARVQSATGRHAESADALAKACDLFPPYGAAHFALAAELRKLGKPAEARQHLALYSGNETAEPPLDDPLFRRIHELNRGVTARLQRSSELEKAGNLPEAIQEQEAALALDPSNVQAHVNLVSLYARTGDHGKAKQHFDTAIRLQPGRSDAWYNFGVLLLGEKNYTEAAAAFRRAIEINPYYAEARTNLGALYEQQGRLDDAAREFRAAIAERPDYPLARFHLGRILANQNQYTEAIQQFEKALTPDTEQTPTYLYALAAAYARAGDREHALTYMRKAHDAAASKGQTRLLTSIERDLQALAAAR